MLFFATFSAVYLGIQAEEGTDAAWDSFGSTCSQGAGRYIEGRPSTRRMDSSFYRHLLCGDSLDQRRVEWWSPSRQRRHIAITPKSKPNAVHGCTGGQSSAHRPSCLHPQQNRPLVSVQAIGHIYSGASLPTQRAPFRDVFRRTAVSAGLTLEEASTRNSLLLLSHLPVAVLTFHFQHVENYVIFQRIDKMCPFSTY